MSILASRDVPSLVLGAVTLGIGLVHLLLTDRMIRIYRHLNRKRAPIDQFWVGWTPLTARGAGFLLTAFGLLLIILYH